MRVVSIDATQLVIHNGCSSKVQQRWATLVLALGMVEIYLLASKVVGNLLYFWGAILCHFLCILLVCWFFAPAIATFNKTTDTLKIEIFGLFITKVTGHSISEITEVQINNRVPLKGLSKICLVLRTGKRSHFSNWWDKTQNCQEVLETIKRFLVTTEN